MKRTIYGLGLALIFGTACKEEPKEPSIAESLKSYTIEQMMDNENVGGGSFSYDNSKLLVSSNRSGIYNMYSVSTADGTWTPVTESDSSSVFAVAYFPEDDRKLFRMDNNGDEIYHIFLMEEDGSSRDLTPDEGARAFFNGWSEDKKSFFYSSNARDNRFSDYFRMDLETFTPELVYQNDQGYDLNMISDNGRYVLYAKNLNTNDSDLFLLDLESGETVQINENQSANAAEDFGPDGKFFYYTTDDGAEFSYLKRYNLETGEREKVMEKDWDIMGSYFTDGGSYQVTYVNEDAKNAIEVLDVETGQAIELPALEGMDITSVGFSRDETMMRFYAGGSHTPSNLYVYNLESKEMKQLSDVLNPEIEGEHLVQAQVVRFPSFDGLEIPAIYYKPHQASEANPAPALVWVHGGPGGQSRQNFNSALQYFVNHGYAILAVNNRGSSGYGKTFYQMDDLNHGDKDLKDCIAGKDWLAQQAEIDGEKIGILGGSYGGFMTMAALTFAPEEFEVGVNLFGVTNWIRTIRSIPPWWASFKDALYKEMGDPYSADSVRLREISPLFHTDQVTKPLIVLQGSQDPRVLQVESDEIVEGVRANGVPVEYVLFEDEGHGFVKKENQIEAYSSILEFLDVYLKGSKEAEVETEAVEQPGMAEESSED
ncbi:Dipeptidyl aminopeptidase/acylaminoacyl peptidase [Robiginitalea myxolifaciens]|uniref:Dipeptidyl aminopeptidase/acylaminoacyl peptidase n=1 Tax=Robiginitalea myxolifaciens TaxID=400055 RepID=A0A1I6FMV0_9FLAO|nr:prolyl oligopeptidase family serine peptidase [Robiginitalea myxolifaciens]SFR31266.1 Dipeptidyl aminopeptidase/acylaminoacyl peptidase [Robiginitalea myxolifaciens]